jgi:ubiquitin-conjugating enzyme E2 W
MLSFFTNCVILLVVFFQQRRLAKELSQLVTEPPTGVKVKNSEGQDLRVWSVTIFGATGTLYDGERFTLQFRFDEQYPFSSPEVMFTGDNIPVHPHVYSNGHICLSILTDDWTPALSVQSVCLSILSMLSSCKEKKRPPDNNFYVRTCNKSPNKTRWWFHDDSV